MKQCSKCFRNVDPTMEPCLKKYGYIFCSSCMEKYKNFPDERCEHQWCFIERIEPADWKISKYLFICPYCEEEKIITK